jgi:hypothetical protein
MKILFLNEYLASCCGWNNMHMYSAWEIRSSAQYRFHAAATRMLRSLLRECAAAVSLDLQEQSQV